MMRGLSLEFKVGFFVIIAIAILSMMVFQIGGINIFNRDVYTIYVLFDFVSGVARDAPVHVAGVAVGDVKEVQILFDPELKKTQVRLSLVIKDKVKLPKDSVAYINTLGILGEKYVEIVPGEDQESFLGDGDFISGNNPVQIEKLTESLVDVIGDQTVRDSLRESFYNVRIATENLRESTETLNQLIGQVNSGQGTIGKFVTDDSIYTKTEAMIDDVNEKLVKTIVDLNTALNDLVSDLKRHPWKLFQKPPKDTTDTNTDEKPAKKNKGFLFFK